MQVKDLIQKLQEWYKPEDHLAVHIWCIDDVTGTADEIGVKLTVDEANEILDDIDRHIDCDLGITWVTIKCAIEDYMGEKANG